MQTLVFESLLIGTITSILGNLIIKILIKFNSVENNDSLKPVLDTYKDTYVIPVALFFTGILIHVLLLSVFLQWLFNVCYGFIMCYCFTLSLFYCSIV